MPNALDDAMYFSMKWEEKMDELIKKIKDTFSPAEIENGIEYMTKMRDEREKNESAEQGLPLNDEEIRQIAEENIERFSLVDILRRRYSIDELGLAIEFLDWNRKDEEERSTKSVTKIANWPAPGLPPSNQLQTELFSPVTRREL